MNQNQGLLSSGLSMLLRNKRYIFWFWLLNLTLAEFGTAAFRRGAHAIMDHSLYAGRVLPSLDLGIVIDLLVKPSFGSMKAMTTPALYFAVLFCRRRPVSAGVFAGYASTYRLPREDFFRACGRNLWRFIRIMIIAAIIMGVLAGLLFAANGAITKKAGESTNEKLPFELQMTGLAVIFLIMTILRIWFDLAEADAVLNDQRAVRKSIRSAFRNFPRFQAAFLAATSSLGSRCHLPRRRPLDLAQTGWPAESHCSLRHRADHSLSAAHPAFLAARHRRLLLAAAHAGSGRRGGTHRAHPGDHRSPACAARDFTSHYNADGGPPDAKA